MPVYFCRHLVGKNSDKCLFHYWNQIRLIIDSLAMIAGALLCAKKELPPLPVAEETHHTEEAGELEETAEKKLN